MFVLEKDLRDAFWKYYQKRKSLLKYQFEVPLREGRADLLTVEEYQGNIQLNAWEFKLNDVKKALAQAELNLPFVNRSWIVLPIEKKNMIEEKYTAYLKEKKYIGVMVVEDGGRWSVIHQPKVKEEYKGNPAITKLLLNKIQ